jgi:DNA processing protein
VDALPELVTAALLPGFGPRKLRELRARGPLAQSLARPAEHADLLPPAALEQLARGSAQRAAEAELNACARQGLRLVGLDDVEYPALLREIYDPPAVLYVRGQLVAGEGAQAVAIVGARAATPQGRALARSLSRDLALLGATIVSGLARGIDSSAHHGAVQASGRTVAILGSSLDRLYPPENERLADDIVAAGGAIVSEFRLGSGPKPTHFPRRNRLISGWARVVVVVEAAERSGALITAREALEAGRDVLAVPGHPTQPLAAGTNALIRDGARLVRHAADVAEEMGLAPRAPAPVVTALPRSNDKDEGRDAVLELLRDGVPASIEDIQASSGRPLPEVLACLAELELQARIRRLPGALILRT